MEQLSGTVCTFTKERHAQVGAKIFMAHMDVTGQYVNGCTVTCGTESIFVTNHTIVGSLDFFHQNKELY